MLRESFDQWLLAGKKVNIIFALNESLVFVKNKEWNAGEKPEEESLRSTSRVF